MSSVVLLASVSALAGFVIGKLSLYSVGGQRILDLEEENAAQLSIIEAFRERVTLLETECDNLNHIIGEERAQHFHESETYLIKIQELLDIQNSLLYDE